MIKSTAYPYNTINGKDFFVENFGLRFGFNGQEKDNEVTGTGNSMTAEYWQYDSRLGRRWNVDPVIKIFESPYATFSNNPILLKDINGRDTAFADNQARTDFSQTYSDINKAAQATQSKIDELKTRGIKKDWSPEKLNRKTNSLISRLTELQKLKNSFDEIISSTTCFIYSTDVSQLDKDAGGHTTQTGENEVTIVFPSGNQGTLVHESRHGFGFTLKEWKGGRYGSLEGYDLEDERQGFLYQMIWDAAAVEKKIETASKNAFPDDPIQQSTYTLQDMIRKYYENKVQYKEFIQHHVK